jgi:hypothetical protein
LSKSQNIDDAVAEDWDDSSMSTFGDGALVPTLAIIDDGLPDLEDCEIYDAAWGPHDCNYITWNAAVCTYPHFVSDESAGISWLGLKEMDVSQHDSYTPWKAEEDRDCLELYPTKVGTQWTEAGR